MKKGILIIFILFILILVSCFLLDKIRNRQENTILALKSKIVPLTFVLEQDGSNIIIEYSFKDLVGNTVYTGKDSLRGKELFIDCIVKEFDSETKLAFPVVFYSDVVAAIDGIQIVELYNNSGFPEIYRGVDANTVQKITKMYSSVLDLTDDKKAFRSSPHVVATKGKVAYQLLLRVRGGLEITQDDNYGQ